ncbi:MAG TPA: IS21-like element helper ATPase IstB [Saprospiraceae bacterium]|nr:IS21-like element helper ATPase IstB [Saprospiraceae bacterium]
MNEQTTIDKMRMLRLKAMADLYDRSHKENLYKDYTADELLALMLDTEWEYRQQDKITNLIARAGFKEIPSMQNIDYKSKRGLDRNTFERLLGLNFLKHKENIIFTGLTGTGKSHLAQCIGIQACRLLQKTMFFKIGHLLEKAKLAKIEGNYMRWINIVGKCSLLIIDDFGTVPIDQQGRNVLLEIIDQRYETASTIITSQIPVSGWHTLIGEATIADAILDRLVYSSHRVELDGESLRKKKILD